MPIAKSQGKEVFAEGRYVAATYYYMQAKEIDPHDATVFSNLSLCLLRMREGEQALKYARECKTLRPDWFKAWYREGMALSFLKNYKGAVDALDQALKLDPANNEIKEALREDVMRKCKSMGNLAALGAGVDGGGGGADGGGAGDGYLSDGGLMQSSGKRRRAQERKKDIPAKRKIEKKREKVLYHESLLKRNPFVQPIPSSVVSKKDKKKAKKKELQETQGEKSAPMEDDSKVKSFDIWAVDGKGDSKAKKRSTTSVIPAVEVEPAGCSFNPPFEAHQDSLAQAVADEKSKEYMKELGPAPVPLIVPGEAITEEDKFFLDADDGDEDAAEDDGDQDADTSVGQRKNKTKRVTRVELNKRARRKERLRAEAEAKKMENISKEIDSLPNIMDEIAKEDEEKEKRRIRRTVVKEERRKSGPPRLGRHKFEPAPVQVLLTEEISGSLRKLKGCCNLARDRYKSIEKRGILAPSKRISKNR